MHRKKAVLLVITLAGIVTSGCGYRVVSGERLFGAKQIAVQPFYEVQAVGMASEMSMHLTRLLAASGSQIVWSKTQAEAVLDGRITFNTTPSATRAGVQAYQVGALVHAELLDTQGTCLWAHDAAIKEDFLPVGGQDVQPLATEANRRAAIRRLAERSATLVHEALIVASTTFGAT